jgi:hypothetical protein
MILLASKFQTTLASGISAASTTATLASNLTADNDSSTLPNGDYGFVIDENNSSREYVIASVVGTALTFVKRGLAMSDGDTEKTPNKKAHRKGSSIKIVDHPVLARIIGTLNGTITSVTNIKSSTAPASDYEYVNKAYVDGAVVSGGVDASTSAKGVSKLSTAPVSATEPIAVGTNDTRMPSQDENDALVGTSGTPSTSNKFVTNDDTASAKTANKIARRDSNGDVLVSTTPTSGDAAASKTYVELFGGTYYVISASDNLKASADTERSTSSAGVYVAGKEIKIRFDGVLRVKFDLRANFNSNGSGTARGKVYKNGAAVGTERVNATETYSTYSEDFSVIHGDLVQLYYQVDSNVGGRTGLCRNFRIYYDKASASDYVVNTD